MDLSSISDVLADLEGRIADALRGLGNGFQKLEKIKDPHRQSRQLEDLTDKMRECKRLIREFETEAKEVEGRIGPDMIKMLHDRKHSMIKDLNTYVTLKKQYTSNLESDRMNLFDGAATGDGEENVLLASAMNNQQMMDAGRGMMDETDDAIERSKKVVEETIKVGTETSAALKAQTEQMYRIVDELDSIHFTMKKASRLVREMGRQIATDKCIMAMLFIIFIGVITIIIVKIVHPENKDIMDIPGLAPPVSRKLLWITD